MDTAIIELFERIKMTPRDKGVYDYLFGLCRNMDAENSKEAHAVNLRMRNDLSRNMRGAPNIAALWETYRKSLLFDAPVSFDAYMQYLEIDREPQTRFWLPRRNVLLPAVNAIQALADDELDELFISMPARVGKTSLLMFFTTWVIGRYPEKSNLYSAFSDTITKAFYNGVLEILEDPTTYLWGDIFPERHVVQTNAADETLNIDRKKRYPSLTARSLYGTLNGACDVNGFAIADDMIGGIEEALNPERLASAWSKVDNNYIPRAKEQAKFLWVGTRWANADPQGLRQDLLQNDEKYASRRYKILNYPALNEKDETNFNYAYGVGFTTAFYQQRRASFERNNDMASWFAQYMGQPVERTGVLFSPEMFRYYNGTLPDRDPDRVFMAVDPAFGGGDFVAAPIIYQYEDDLYVVDVVYDNRDKNVTMPMLVSAVEKHGVAAMQIEATRATESYKEGIEKMLKDDGIRINLTSKPAPSDRAKFERIRDKAPDIRDRMIFLESGKRSKTYDQFLMNVFSYKLLGKNKNDDAPDSLSMAIDMTKIITRKIEVFKRPF